MVLEKNNTRLPETYEIKTTMSSFYNRTEDDNLVIEICPKKYFLTVREIFLQLA